MRKNLSAGLLMYRLHPQGSGEVQFFLVHPGGPYFTKKDKGWWGIPKGLPQEGEALLPCAVREFEEETGIRPGGPYLALESIKQKGGKTVWAWAFAGQWQEQQGIQCNTFRVEWPYKSGNWQHYPEVDQARWFAYPEAIAYINAAQIPFLDRLLEQLGYTSPFISNQNTKV
ncbi:NUDIX domain-containing protein [Cesiribacter andamanensis]|uniref:Putative NTP pyrophosphohydrolase n=1 Tax=Cesiribacter andamanensis AMV16 TaxID=1279009 RepID=M7NU86_9BACT|nr:NUDIX domain-containing protein [Cesiribacter andamanensis]EMR02054.1 putative NTP pyrophosphohydrolase [Cesiribacter andamanensis AMV16]